jgi:MtN3 and saliva related transmembrane protein
MNLVFIGVIGVLLTAFQLVPQVYKTIKTNSAKDLSLWTLIIIFLGATTWIIYSIYLNDVPIMIANCLNLIFSLILLYKKIF